MSKIIKIADKNDSAGAWSVEDMLKDALKVIKEEPRWSKKAIVLFLDESDDEYGIRTLVAGIPKTTGVINLLDIAHGREKDYLNQGLTREE